MKWINKLLTLIVLSFFWAIPFSLLWILVKKLSIEPVKYIPFLYVCFVFISLLYKKIWSFETFNTKKGTIKFLCVFFISVFVSVYLNTSVYRSYKLYEYIVEEKKRGWEGIAHQPDDTLGFTPLPNARAYHTFPVGNKVPMAYDKTGFRIPLSDTLNDRSANTDLLFLGCSFTYGDGCYAEETFPYLVAKNNNLSYINAGVCSYGLAHMLIIAQRLIPKYKPKYIILQYSEWLAGRSINIYAPTYFGYLPNPFFAEENNNFSIQYPTFKSQIFNLNTEKIKHTYQDKFGNFFFEKGLLFYLKEDWFYQKNRFLTITGQQLEPTTKQDEVEKYAYNKIIEIAKSNGSKVIILNLGNTEYPTKWHQLFSDSTVFCADADSELNEFLKKSTSKNYSKEFNLWRFEGTDSILVDPHPNFKAHRIIANSIIKEINKLESK